MPVNYAILDEYSRIPKHGGEAELQLLEAALFIEEAFGIRLSDDEISVENLGSLKSMRRFIERRLEE